MNSSSPMLSWFSDGVLMAHATPGRQIKPSIMILSLGRWFMYRKIGIFGKCGLISLISREITATPGASITPDGVHLSFVSPLAGCHDEDAPGE